MAPTTNPPLGRRLGEPTVTVKVRDLGYRWGSARPTKSPQHINIHWATLQLPPTLIDYILVHELAHLRETNHTPQFWTIVERLMPGYQTQKATLAAIGKNIWLGSVTECAGVATTPVDGTPASPPKAPPTARPRNGTRCGGLWNIWTVASEGRRNTLG